MMPKTNPQIEGSRRPGEFLTGDATRIVSVKQNLFEFLRSPAYAEKLDKGFPVTDLWHEAPDVYVILLAVSRMIDRFRCRPAAGLLSQRENATLVRSTQIHSTSIVTGADLVKLEAAFRVWQRCASKSSRPQDGFLQCEIASVHKASIACCRQ